MNQNSSFYAEGEIFSRYLLQGDSEDRAVELYVETMGKLTIQLASREERILAFLLQNPRAVGLVDTGLADTPEAAGNDGDTRVIA